MGTDHPLTPHLPLIDRIVRSLARRKCLSTDEAEELAAEVKLKLVEDAGAVFEKFEGKSSLPTYLTVVIHNLFRDFRIARLGKWRPSGAAQRMGTVAVQLESLLFRDGFSFGEACEKLWTNFQVCASAEELERMASRLPTRVPRRFEGEETLARLPATNDSEEGVRLGEAQAKARQVELALAAAVRNLPDEDRLILELHIGKGLTLAATARALQLEQKPLYRRLPRLLGDLRRELERRGVRREDVCALLSGGGAELTIDFGTRHESARMRPSKGKGR